MSFEQRNSGLLTLLLTRLRLSPVAAGGAHAQVPPTGAAIPPPYIAMAPAAEPAAAGMMPMADIPPQCIEHATGERGAACSGGAHCLAPGQRLMAKCMIS